jgi:hypothetical protein
MVKWISRQEKVESLDYYHSIELPVSPSQSAELDGTEAGISELESVEDSDEQEVVASKQAGSANATRSQDSRTEATTKYTMAKKAPEHRKSIARVMLTHSTPNFLNHLKEYLNSLAPTDQRRKGQEILTWNLPFDCVDVWHQFKLTIPHVQLDGELVDDCVKAIPVWRKNKTPRFDTVVVSVTDEAQATALEGIVYQKQVH